MRALDEARIAVVGLGLMGGSLAGALRGKCREVVGTDRDASTVRAAQSRRLVNRGSGDPVEALHGADVVVLATPVRAILHQLEALAPHLPEGCLVLDLGSTKAQIVARMAHLPEGVQPLGGHPMCGKERSGVDAAEPGLYRDKIFVLTPLARTSPEALALGEAVVEAAGARPLVVEPERHDRLVAAISHLPYLLACGLVDTAAAIAPEDPLVRTLAASGFHSTSRLAGSDVAMMVDILLTNREAVLEAFRSCESRLHALAHLIAAGDEPGIEAALGEIRKEREAFL